MPLPSDPFVNVTIDPAKLGQLMAEEIRKLPRERTDWPLTTMPPDYGYAPPSLTEADVRRIVREEMEAAKPGPLDVSAEDVRRYLPRGLP
jgi:hypothetical protein